MTERLTEGELAAYQALLDAVRDSPNRVFGCDSNTQMASWIEWRNWAEAATERLLQAGDSLVQEVRLLRAERDGLLEFALLRRREQGDE